jgi:hypothetical protein
MNDISGPTRTALAKLRHQTFYVTELADGITFGVLSNQQASLSRLPNALRVLRARVDEAINMLEGEHEL